MWGDCEFSLCMGGFVLSASVHDVMTTIMMSYSHRVTLSSTVIYSYSYSFRWCKRLTNRERKRWLGDYDVIEYNLDSIT